MTIVSIVGAVLIYALYLFLLLLIGRLILEYVQMFARSWRPTGVVLVLAEIVYTTTDPPLKLLRRFIPPLRLGSVAIDLSFLVLVILIFILIQVVQGVLVY